MTTKRATAPPTEDAPRAATVEEATAAQRDSDTAALAGHYTEDAIAAATPAATPPAEGQKASSDAATVTATEAASKESWRDWASANDLPYEPAVTRGELLARLARMGLDVSEPALRAWERDGLLPQPLKRWHEGATRAIYPMWAFNSLLLFRILKREGHPLQDVAQRVRASFHLHRVPDRFGLADQLAHVAREIEQAKGLPAGTLTNAELRFRAPNGYDSELFVFVLAPDDDNAPQPGNGR